MSYQRNLALVKFLTLANLITFVTGQFNYRCDGETYSNNSIYQSNLNTLLSILSTNIDNTGFYNASVGQRSDSVYAVALCRGDDQLDICRSCVENATSLLVRSCSNNRAAIVWDEFCTLRYSDSPLYGVLNVLMESVWRNPNSTTSPLISADIITLANNLRSQAANGSSLRKVAYGNRGSVYALLQCTPDLSREGCDRCLNVAFQGILSSWERLPRGAGILTRSCFLRYETTSIFYNETRLQELANLASSGPVAMPVPIPQPPAPSHSPGNRDTNSAGNRNYNTTIIIVIIVAAIGGVIILFLIVYLAMKMKQKSKEETENGEESDEISIFQSLQYEFNVIKDATNDFSDDNKLGQGGFGVVYRGKLPNGQEIAVKRLARGSCQGGLEFKNEVMILVKLQHKNLVRLLGFSLEGTEKVLVYEFVQNASLDHLLFDSRKRVLLDWDRRHKIIRGIARGILYLHEDSRLQIIHRDLKASNILLDGDMNPKIADFGMARLFVQDDTQGSTSRIVGTYGYMAPEYVMRGQFSVKSDMFSFGVLLLEIISGQKINCFRHRGTEANLLSTAWESWRKGTITNLVDPVLMMVGSSMSRDILRLIHIGLLCVQENAIDRPTIASVILMLNSLSVTLVVPSQPAFYVYGENDTGSFPLQELSWGEENSDRVSNNERNEFGDSISQNEMSISELHVR